MVSETPMRERVNFASRGSTKFDILLALFCSVLVISNVSATKGIEFGPSWSIGSFVVSPILTDGGAFLFPLAYILGDVISEVYGFAAARRAIIAGFGMAVLAALTFWAVSSAPGSSDYLSFHGDSDPFAGLLGFVPRIVLASVCGYVVGQFLNSWVLVKMKEHTAETRLLSRLAGSTGVGELADTFIFCAIAAGAIGITTAGSFFNYFLYGYVYKCLVELIFMPVTIQVIKWLKRREPTYWS